MRERIKYIKLINIMLEVILENLLFVIKYKFMIFGNIKF